MNADQQMKQTHAYMDAHCAAFMGRPENAPVARTGYEQQCIDRGLLDGSRARETALAEAAAPSALEAYWAGSAVASVTRDYAAGRVVTVKASGK